MRTAQLVIIKQSFSYIFHFYEFASDINFYSVVFFVVLHLQTHTEIHRQTDRKTDTQTKGKIATCLLVHHRYRA